MAAVRRDFHIWIIIIILVIFMIAMFFSPSFRGGGNKEEEKPKAIQGPSSDEIMAMLKKQQEDANIRMQRLEERTAQTYQRQVQQTTQAIDDDEKRRMEIERMQKEIAIATSPIIKINRGEVMTRSAKDSLVERPREKGENEQIPVLPESQDESGKPKRAWKRSDDKDEFRQKASNEMDISVNAPVEAYSKTMVHQGTAIPVVLVTEISSDNPGMIVAEVMRDVYDSISGKYLLIPKGSRIVGTYMDDIQVGEDKLMAAFNRIIFPNGNSIDLSSSLGAEGLGTSGLKDRVNNHFWKMFGSSFLIAAIGYATDRSLEWWDSGEGSSVNVYSNGSNPVTTTGSILEDISRTILDRNRNIQPTIEIRSGKRFMILVQRDLHIPLDAVQ